MINLYGISNCDTVRKAKKYLEQREIDFYFIDFKKKAPTLKLLESCKKHLGFWPVNTRGTTYRKFKDEYVEASEKEQVKLLIDQSSMIKRPIIEIGGKVECVGFSIMDYEKVLKKNLNNA